ncbi:MAG: hypothetical protein AB1485_10085 [Candidatus Thermoplasmatota archaeon]
MGRGLLQKLSSILAFRVSIEDQDAFTYINQIASTCDISQLILILDGGFIGRSDDNDTGNKSYNFSDLLDTLDDRFTRNLPKATICAFSSFPSAVGKKPYGEYNQGKFPISEVITNKALQKSYKFILHGDYGSVHPFRYETAGGGWVPRVDFLTEDSFYYHRYQRENGGYIKAASEVISDSNYRRIRGVDVWGDQEILAAANNTPNGLSPSHWIAVRINLYITKQYLRLTKGSSYISL